MSLKKFKELWAGKPTEVNPHVWVFEVGPTSLAFHEETGGSVEIHYEGGFGEKADLESNVRKLRRDGNKIVGRGDGRITGEFGMTNHHRDVEFVITPDNFRVKGRDLL